MFDKVNNYYLQNLAKLPFPKQFHYVSRLWFWSNDVNARNWLDNQRAMLCGDGSKEGIDQGIRDLLLKKTNDFGAKHAVGKRAPYFEKYPLLKSSSLVLFRLLYLQTIYGIDARAQLADHFVPADLDKMYQDLGSDPLAVSILSTHAVNFFYLFDWSQNRTTPKTLAEKIYHIGLEQYELAEQTDRLLLIYLYTHCIIGDSLFYSQPLSKEKSNIHQMMIENLQSLIKQHFTNVSLDNKCEFLVCAKLCGITSSLEPKIFAEADQSISPDGTYIIDTHNYYRDLPNHSLEDSEHRNILFVMSGTNTTLTSS